MTGLHADARLPRTTRKSAVEPPGYDRVASAFRKSARLLLAVAILAGGGGLGLVAAALVLDPAGGLGTPVFLAAGGFLIVVALLPLVLAWRRRKRVAFLAALRARWVQLARAGDPHDQIATLSRAYAGLVGNDLRTRLGAAP
jgi:hypothetical protein